MAAQNKAETIDEIDRLSISFEKNFEEKVKKDENIESLEPRLGEFGSDSYNAVKDVVLNGFLKYFSKLSSEEIFEHLKEKGGDWKYYILEDSSDGWSQSFASAFVEKYTDEGKYQEAIGVVNERLTPFICVFHKRIIKKLVKKLAEEDINKAYLTVKTELPNEVFVSNLTAIAESLTENINKYDDAERMQSLVSELYKEGLSVALYSDNYEYDVPELIQSALHNNMCNTEEILDLFIKESNAEKRARVISKVATWQTNGLS